MHYFIAEVAQQELGAMQGFLRRAQTIYDDNLGAYVKLVMRRPMGKAMVRKIHVIAWQAIVACVRGY